MTEREVEIVVISDVHLGTYGCHATELLNYLHGVRPKVLVLNGDIIDAWQFSKRYWPDTHMQVIRKIMKFVAQDVQVYYLTGNHDEMLRKFADMELGSFRLSNKLVLPVGSKRAWLFHGDVFDLTMQHSKWLAKLGAIGYDSLILLNSFVNRGLGLCGREKMSFSRKIKSSVKSAVKFMNDFEMTAAGIAIENGYDYVICGHIHQPGIREIVTPDGAVTYLNSGDWVESLSSLEYHSGEWKVYYYDPLEYPEAGKEGRRPREEEDLKAMTDVNLLYRAMVGGQ